VIPVFELSIYHADIGTGSFILHLIIKGVTIIVTMCVVENFLKQTLHSNLKRLVYYSLIISSLTFCDVFKLIL
jgi:hypothetical protein